MQKEKRRREVGEESWDAAAEIEHQASSANVIFPSPWSTPPLPTLPPRIGSLYFPLLLTPVPAQLKSKLPSRVKRESPWLPVPDLGDPWLAQPEVARHRIQSAGAPLPVTEIVWPGTA